MGKKLLKLASVMLVLAIIFTSFTTAVSAKTAFSCYTFEIEDIKNPLYKEIEEPEISSFSLTPKRYYASGSPFDIGDCISDINVIATDMRKTMVDRDASLDVYYVCDFQHNSETLSALLTQLSELTFAETESPVEGDYLQYVYRRISSGRVTMISDGEKYYYHLPLGFEYNTTKSQEDELTKEINRVIDGFGFNEASTPRQKSDKIYQYITQNVVYDYKNLNDPSYNLKFTAYAALINKTAVCQGYATLYYRMARECGLNTRVVTGKSRGENHAWNIVKIGGYYYYLDSTWDAGQTKYDYYLKGSTNFTIDHTPEDHYFEDAFTQKYPISNEDLNLHEDGNSDLYMYEIYMGNAIVTGYKGNEKHIVVPAQLGGYPVSRIGQKIFFENNTVESITFSEGIEYIEQETIAFCQNLKQVNFPASMTVNFEKYGDAALGGYTAAPVYCNNLETITLAAGSTKMKLVDGILYTADGTGLILCPTKYNKSKVTIPDGVTTIAPFAFYGCENIKEVVMPDTVKYIGYWAFDVSRNLEKINISEDCRIIGQFAFANTKLTNIYIPASVEQIGGGAFGVETDLKEITVDPENEHFYMQNGALIYHNTEFDTRTILDYETDNTATVFTVPNNINGIDQYAFALANKLEQIILHDDVESISSYAFENSKNISHFEFPDGIKQVDSYVLFGCDGLASVIIPASVTEIGEMVISGNYGCTIYGQSGSVAESYALANGNPFKTIDQFTCTTGHNLVDTFKNEYDHCLVCQNCGDEARMFSLTPIEPFAQEAKVEYEHYRYTGKEIKPRIAKFEYDGKKFVQGVDYVINGYYNNVNVGTGYIEIKGIGDYAGTGYIYFQIKAIPITTKQIGIEYLATYYDGTEKCPIIQIDGLREFEDFNVEYSNNINPGTATATITAWGNYEGTVSVKFEIVEKGDKLKKEGSKYYLYRDGVKCSITDLVKIDGTWYYIEKGVWASKVDALYKINGKWFLIKQGKWKATTGIVEFKGKNFYVEGGKWKSDVNDLKKLNGKWYFIKGGKWDSSLESLHKLNGKWFLVKDGMWKATTGLVSYKGKKFYVVGGKWQSRNDIVKISGKYYYIKGGKWDKTQTTLFKKNGKLFAVKNGMWHKSKVIIKYSGKKYYCNKGYAQTSFSGKAKVNSKTYTVKKGIVK